VTVSRPLSGKVTDYAYFTGRTKAIESVEVRAQVGGYLTKVAYDPGQEVKKGQLLFQIDPTVYEAARDKAKADVALYAAQKRLQDIQVTRQRQLVGRGIAQEELDKTIALRDQAIANMAAAEAALRTAEQNLAWTRVTSPIDGKTSVNLLTVGNLVVANQTLLATVVSQDPMYAYFDVDERTVLHVQKLIREGKVKSYQKAKYPVDVGLANEEGYPHHGVIDYVGNQVNTGTGTLTVRGVFRNPLIAGRLRVLSPGLFLRVRIPVGPAHGALLVTDRALGSDQGQKYLLVVNARNEVERRDVEAGARYNGLRVITAGLRPDEWVIVDGLLRVRPGVPVEPRRQPMPTSPAAAKARASAGARALAK
jgi:RND family efflux transporter MFP subunit